MCAEETFSEMEGERAIMNFPIKYSNCTLSESAMAFSD